MSGPSGVGKSTLVRKLIARTGDRLRKSVSATTRPPRPGEVDGVDYHFLAADEFRRRVAAGEFLEAIEVFGRGHWYGTLLAEVLPSLAAGRWVLLEIDVDGAERALAKYPDAVTLFVAPAADPAASERVLEERLRARGTEDEASLRRRLEVARHELQRASRYEHLVVNEGLDDAVDRLVDALVSEGFVMP
jgi:guanylate kinase